MATIYKKSNRWDQMKLNFWLDYRHIAQKLLKPYYKKKYDKYRHKKYYIAVYFDGTLVEDKYPDIGPGKNTIQKLLFYYDLLESIDITPVIILWTYRTGLYLEEAKEWTYKFLSPRIRPRYFNENPEVKHESLKIFAHEYWDDCGRRIQLHEGYKFTEDKETYIIQKELIPLMKTENEVNKMTEGEKIYAEKAMSKDIPKETVSSIKTEDENSVERLAVNVYLEEILPNSLKGEFYGISTTIIAESIERLGTVIKELKDPKNSPIITDMISQIFKEHGEEMLFGKHKAKITVIVKNSQQLIITKYTRILLGGYEFMEDNNYAEKEIQS